MSNNKKTAKKYVKGKSWEKRESRDMKRDEKKDKFEDAKHRAGTNDVSWYVPNVQMLHDVANLPWSEQAGQKLPRKGHFPGDRLSTPFPGICNVYVNPVLGMASAPNDPVNVAAQSIYTFVRHQNSGSKNYDATDLMIYIMSLDSIYYMVSWLTRIYATINMYSMQNKYLPDVLLRSQGIDASTIRRDMPGFRSRINSLILKISTMVIPNSMPIFKRHSFLFNNYYTEGTSIKDQIYFYTPKNYYVFKYDSNGAGMLQSRIINTGSEVNTLYTADSLIQILTDMVDAIYMEEDFGVMAGDILKAYGEGGVEKVGLIPDMIIATPVYNYEVLNQIKNSQFYRIPTGDLDITQIIDPNYPVSPYIHQFPTLSGIVYGQATSAGVKTHWSGTGICTPGNDDFSMFMNIYDDISGQRFLVSSNPNVSPEETMVSSRNTVSLRFEQVLDSGVYKWNVTDICYGTEIPACIEYWGNTYTTGSPVPTGLQLMTYNGFNIANAIPSGVDPDYWISNPCALPSLIASFKYHPAHNSSIWYSKNSDFVGFWNHLPNIDIDNYTLVSFDTLKKLHSIATLGEYNVPLVSLS